MPELREDLTTKDWVVFATERARRPHDPRHEQSHAETQPARAAACPFCPGNESQTPGEIDRLVPAGAPDQLADAALATRHILRLLRRALGDPPLNYVVHTAPVADEERPYFIWHIQIVPRLTVAAGFEMGSGMYINTAVPEQTAAFLHEADSAHQ